MSLQTVLIEDSKTIAEALIPALADLAHAEVTAIADTASEAVAVPPKLAETWNLAVVDLFLREGLWPRRIARLQGAGVAPKDGRVGKLSDRRNASPKFGIANVVFDNSKELDFFWLVRLPLVRRRVVHRRAEHRRSVPKRGSGLAVLEWNRRACVNDLAFSRTFRSASVPEAGLAARGGPIAQDECEAHGLPTAFAIVACPMRVHKARTNWCGEMTQWALQLLREAMTPCTCEAGTGRANR